MSWHQHQGVQIYRSFDMGFFPDPAYCLWIAHLGDRYIAFKEKKWLKTIAIDIARDIKAESEGMKVVTTYCDPSIDINTGADIRTIKDIFDDNGVPMENSINNREFYAQAIHAGLGQEVRPGVPLLQILEGSGKTYGCPYLIKTLPMMRYDEKHPLAMADHRDDHPTVALAYFLISSGAMERKGTGLSQFSSSTPRWMRPKHDSTLRLGSESVRDY